MNRLPRLSAWCVALFLVSIFSTVAPATNFTRGDSNGDGGVDIGDAVNILTYLFSGGSVDCLDSVDANDDGLANIGDAIFLLDYIFSGGTTPPAPAPGECGPDPTPDLLDCIAFDICPQVTPPVAMISASVTSGELPLEVFFDADGSSDPDGSIVSYDWDFGDGNTDTGFFTSHTYSTTGMFEATLTVTDDDGETDSASVTITTAGTGPPVTIESSSPTHGDDGVAVTRETIIRFTTPIVASTVTPDAISVVAPSGTLNTLLHVKPGAILVDTVTIFYPDLLPASTILTVFIDGDELSDSIGRAIDADGDGVEGGIGVIEFETLSLTLVPDTAVCGRVFASELVEVGGVPVNNPLQGVTVTIDGLDPGIVSAVTDELGSFRLEPVPAGRFFVHIDGRTVASALIDGVSTPTTFPDGPYYPFVGKPFVSKAGQEVLLDDIFLPLVEAGTLQAVSATEDTVICFSGDIVTEFPELDGVCITVPAGSLYADDGTPGGMVGIAPVDPARLPGPLPPGLEFALVITVQTDGATNFEEPAPICFPNLPDPVSGEVLAAGEQTALWSFNHDTGEWEVVGTMTVTADGALVCSDPGVGILAPGWHAVNRGVPANGGPISEGDWDPNNPPPGYDQEPSNDDEDADAACGTEGRVYLHNGEETLERVDLMIPGRGDIDFVMSRRYRSRFQADGPLGYGWDFAYNDYFYVEPNGDLTRCNGRGKIDTWARIAVGTYATPAGFFRSLSRDPNNLIVQRSPDGFKRLYHENGRLFAYEDRHGNRMVFEYDANGNLDLVIDPYGREIDFVFEEVAGRDRLVRIRDFIGREVVYTYDTEGNLTEVRSPVITGTSTGNDFPDGRTERYTYSSGFTEEALNHNILSVTRPEQVADGGPPAQTWEYGTDPGDPMTFDRVIAEHLGGGLADSSGVPAGGTITYQYFELNPGAPLGDLDLPRGMALVTERNGNQFEAYVNEQNHHIMTRELTRGLRVGEPAFYETRTFFDVDGQITRVIHPEGNETVYTYDMSGEKGAQKNLIELRRIADPDRGGGEDLVTTMAYEPLFNQLLSWVDPRGNATAFTPPIGIASAERYTHRHVYDYQEGTPAEILQLADDLGVDLDPDGAGPITALMVAQELSLDADVNADGRTDQQHGNRIRLEQPTVQRVDADGTVSSQMILTEYQWNDDGQLVRVIDPEGNVQLNEYYSGPTPAGGVSYFTPFFPAITEDNGFLRRFVVDAEDSYRRTSTVPPAALATEYTYDEVGNRIAIRDPRGVVTTAEYNALDETVAVTRGADVTAAISAGELLTGESAFGYERRNFYDPNGNMIRVEVENADGTTDGVGSFVEFTYDFDLLDNLVERTAEVDATTTLTWQHRYDESENPTLYIAPEGNRIRTTFDERDLVFQVTRGELSPDASVLRTDYDLNRNVAIIYDAEDNDGDGEPETAVFTYDGFDRQVSLVNAIGTEKTYDYDPNSNRVRVATSGHPAGAPAAAAVALEEAFVRYDELDRPYQLDESLFLSTGFSPTQPVTLNDDNSDGLVTTRTVYDALSRVIAEVDDDLQVTSFEYDGADRFTRMVDPVGNERTYVYDRNSNVVRETSLEVATDMMIVDEVYESYMVYDQLDRLVRSTDNLGQTKRYAYDSRDNLVGCTDEVGGSIADPLGVFPGLINTEGNSCVIRYDGLDRILAWESALRVGGTGDGAIDTSNPDNPDGIVTVQHAYDRNSRLVARIDDNGNTTSYQYDELDRLVREINADLTERVYQYDRCDHLVQITDPNGTSVDRTFDGEGRMTQIDITPAAGIVGTSQVLFEYDGLGRRTRSVDDNGGAPQACEYVFDSLSRCLEERQNGRVVSRVLAGDGRRLSSRYPGGRVLDFAFDANDREISCSDGGSPIADHTWVGFGFRSVRRQLGNGVTETSLDAAGTMAVGYDGVRRAVSQRTLLPGGAEFLNRAYEYNRADHRRSEIRIDDFSQTDRVEYDSLYRVISSEFDADGLAGAMPRDLQSRTYQLDGVGNRRAVNEDFVSTGLVATTYLPNEVNEYTTVGAVARTHSDNGNLLDDGSRSFTYDYRNRLIEVRDALGDLVADYRYFADHRRAEKRTYGAVTPGVLDSHTLFSYDGQRLVEEADALTGLTTSTYVWSPTYVDDLIQWQRTADHPLGVGDFYAHQNVRFDVIGVTDGAGAVVETFLYDDYGTPTQTSSVGLAYLFQGRRFDPESGLYYYRARHYDSTTGRFLQRDPVFDPANSLNLYSFVGNRPLHGLDPSGMVDWEWWGDFAGSFANDMWDDTGGAVIDGVSGSFDRAIDRGTLVTEQTGSVGEGLLQVFGSMGGDLIGVNDGYEAVTGKETFDEYVKTGNQRELTAEERAQRALSAAEKAAAIALAGARFARCKPKKPPEPPKPDVKCFPPGTLVLMADGSAKAIENIQPGDEVLADDPSDAERPAAHRVIRTIVGSTLRFIVIRLDADGDGRADGELEATGEHPIWTVNGGWRFAHALRPGDRLVTPDGDLVRVIDTQERWVESDTYNLTVADIHTFYVVTDGGTVLVHNQTNDETPDERRKREQRERRQKRREDNSRAENGQNRSGQGENARRRREQAEREAAERREGERIRKERDRKEREARKRERNVGIDEEHSRVAKGQGGRGPRCN